MIVQLITPRGAGKPPVCCSASKKTPNAKAKLHQVSKLSPHKKSIRNSLITCFPAASFSVNCGGPEQSSQSGTVFDDDSEKLGAASLYTSSNNKWAVSSSGVYISNPNGPTYTAQTDSQITNTLDSELYKTARIAPTSLRYYGLHFAEVVMDDNAASWKGLGRRLFDVYVQVSNLSVVYIFSFKGT